jgi:predicted Zn-dependent protease
MFDSRIPDALNRTEKLGYKQYIDSLDYQLVKARASAKLAENKTNALATIKDQINQQKYQSLTTAKYTQALLLQELQQHTKAEAILNNLAAENPDNIILQLSWLESLSRTKPTTSKLRLKELQAANPEHLPINILCAQSLLNSNDYSAALDILLPYDKNNIYALTEEHAIYKILISCYQKLNQTDLSLLMQAKSSVLSNKLTLAEQQLQQALKVAKKANLGKIKNFQQQLKEFMQEIEEIKL